jgi:hypothetical protein
LQCLRLVACANDLIEGRLGVIEASRQFCYLRSWFRAESDPDFVTFVGIDSETDQLPLGEVRKHWASEALEEKDIAIQQSETLYRSQAIEAARNLVKKYEVSDKE